LGGGVFYRLSIIEGYCWVLRVPTGIALDRAKII
jgi:hypothetical protein